MRGSTWLAGTAIAVFLAGCGSGNSGVAYDEGLTKHNQEWAREARTVGGNSSGTAPAGSEPAEAVPAGRWADGAEAAPTPSRPAEPQQR